MVRLLAKLYSKIDAAVWVTVTDTVSVTRVNAGRYAQCRHRLPNMVTRFPVPVSLVAMLITVQIKNHTNYQG